MAKKRAEPRDGIELIISEKNIAAEKIAKILSDGGAKTSKLRGVPVYEFGLDGRHHAVVGLKGHIVAMDYPKKYNQWFRVKPRELVHVEPERRVEEKEIAAAIQGLAKRARRVVIATDYDREGELIGAEALQLIREAVPSIDAKRMRFSAITKEEIHHAYDALTDLDVHLAASAEARQVIDLAWGATLTRFISLAAGQVGEDFLSIGRVQSPTLALVVDKEKEIRSFVPEAYWEIEAELEKGTRFSATHSAGRFKDAGRASEVFAGVKPATQAIVKEAHKAERREKPPEPFNTTAFLAAATRMGMSAAKAMNVAEGLYMNGWISYPRTDNTHYPPSLDLREILKKLSGQEQLGHLAERILEQPELKPTHGKKTATDHPPIHPTDAPRKSDLGAEEWKVYELVARRFLATLAPEARILGVRVTLDIRGEAFEARGQRVLEAGWKALYPYVQAKETLLPEMHAGEQARVVEITLSEKATQPPKRLSQGRLIEEMESLGLGTKSTRHEIINKLYARGYLRNSPPEPSETGFAVTEALEQYATHIAKPAMTAKLEAEMDEIADGRKAIQEVVADSRAMLEEILGVLEQNRPLIADRIRRAIDQQNTIGKCPRDGGMLLVRRGQRGKRFAGCSNYPACLQTFPLPQYGRIVAEQEQCEACRSPVIKIVNRGRRPWVLCVNMQCPNRGKGEVVVAKEPAAAVATAGAEEEIVAPPEVGDERVEELPHSDEPTEVEEREIE